MSDSQTFRANVGVVLLNDRWEALALERIDKDAAKQGIKQGTGQWQLPQGGLDLDEEPQDAWRRELREELGINEGAVQYIGEYPEWLVYELPNEVRQRPEVQKKQGRGQVQKWYFVRLKPNVAINLEGPEQEFVKHRWMSLEHLAEEAWEVRRPIYRLLAAHADQLKRAKQLASTN